MEPMKNYVKIKDYFQFLCYVTERDKQMQKLAQITLARIANGSYIPPNNIDSPVTELERYVENMHNKIALEQHEYNRTEYYTYHDFDMMELSASLAMDFFQWFKDRAKLTLTIH